MESIARLELCSTNRRRVLRERVESTQGCVLTIDSVAWYIRHPHGKLSVPDEHPSRSPHRCSSGGGVHVYMSHEAREGLLVTDAIPNPRLLAGSDAPDGVLSEPSMADFLYACEQMSGGPAAQRCLSTE
jgi:hypothetical protein